ncbi:MAG: zinc ribbon domain-containing protein [Myxococcota bacterium]
MSTQDLGTYQMLWDCPSCGAEKLLGLDHRHCPNCGAAQDPARRYFPNDSDKILVKDHRYTGADLTCPACDTPNAKSANNCVNCGSGLAGAKEVARRSDQAQGPGLGFAADSAKQAAADFKQQKQAARGTPVVEAPPPNPRSKAGILIGLGVLAFAAALVVFFTWKKSVEVEVTGHSWLRSIDVEEYRSVSHSAWRDQVPSEAHDLSCSRAERSSRKVPDGEECHDVRKDLGNGTYKEVRQCETKYRSEPVYDEKCSFLVERWVKDYAAEEKGNSLQDPPRWPQANLSRPGNCLGCQRLGPRSERYEVGFKVDAGSVQRCAFPEATWRTFEIGARFSAEARAIGGSLDCDSIKR